jgi:hypothetical protein
MWNNELGRVFTTIKRKIPTKLKIFIKNIYKYKFRTLTYKSAFERVVKIPKHYDVNTLRLHDEYLWPYIRNDIMVALTGQNDYAKRHVKFTPFLSQKGHVENLPLEYRNIYKEKYGCIEIEELSEYRDIDYLFVTNLSSVEDVEIDGRVYKRLTDPLYEAAGKFATPLKIELVKFKSKYIVNEKNYFHPAVALLPPVAYKKNYANEVVLDDEFIRILRKHCPTLPITKEFIKELLNWNLHTKAYWLDILKKTRPKAVLTIGYHRAGPMIAAAHDLGIKSVDIQHGVQRGWNPIYNDWEEMPAEGYQALPDIFAVWSQEEKEHISNIFRGSKHRALVTGYPWLTRQKDFAKHQVPKILLEKRKQYPVCALLSLQREKKVSKNIQVMIRQSPDILWVVRSHPKGKAFQLSDFAGMENIVAEPEINTMYVSQLLEYIDFHVTEGSTMIKEVAFFNVPSILIKEENLVNFEKEIAEGIAYKAFSPEELQSVVTTLERKGFKINSERESINPEDALKACLD